MSIVQCHLQFFVTNKKLRDSATHSRCHQSLLSEEIRLRKRHFYQLKLQYDNIFGKWRRQKYNFRSKTVCY